MTRTTLKDRGRQLLRQVKCPRCSSSRAIAAFPTIEEAREHLETSHGDFISLRTKSEYISFLREHYDVKPVGRWPADFKEALELAEKIPSSSFLAETRLKKMERKTRKCVVCDKPLPKYKKKFCSKACRKEGA